MIDWQKMRRPLAAIVLCGAVTTGLQGCVEMVVGGTVMGVLAATDRRTLGAQAEDHAIMLKGESRVGKLVGNAGQVNVSSFNRRALLTGEVRDEAMKAAVEREIGAVEGVLSVINELEIAGTSSFTSRSNDTLITGKVKASFIDARDLFANAFRVTTERGIVYLQGRVTEREGNRGAQVAAGVSGVRKVVKVFDYITEDELNSMTLKPNTQPSAGAAR